MALIARIQHPYIVEFKEAWVEKVRDPLSFFGVVICSDKFDTMSATHKDRTFDLRVQTITFNIMTVTQWVDPLSFWMTQS